MPALSEAFPAGIAAAVPAADSLQAVPACIVLAVPVAVLSADCHQPALVKTAVPAELPTFAALVQAVLAVPAASAELAVFAALVQAVLAVPAVLASAVTAKSAFVLSFLSLTAVCLRFLQA